LPILVVNTLLVELLYKHLAVWISSASFHLVQENALMFLCFFVDTDTVVPLTSTRRSLTALGLPVKTSWYPWRYMVPTEVSVFILEQEKEATKLHVKL
jgi:hypothetical protein